MGFWKRLKKASETIPAILSGYFGSTIPALATQTDQLLTYSANPWVYTGVQLIATSIAKTPFYVEDEHGEKVKDHPITTLLDNPNPGMEAFDFFEGTQTYMELGGECFWEVVTDNMDIPRELWPLRPDRIELNPDKERRQIAGYTYTVGGSKVEFAADEIIHVKFFHPTNDWRGHSSIEALTDYLNAEAYANRWLKRFLRRYGVSEGFLQTDQRPGAPEIKRLREKWSKRTGGDDDLTPLLPAGLKYEELAKPIKESGLFEALRLIRESQLAALGVPPVLAGLLEFARYSNYDLQLRAFSMMTCVPKLLKLESAINRGLMPRYKNGKGKGKQRFVFDKDKIGFISMELLSKIAMELADRTAATPNDLVDITGIGSKYPEGESLRVLAERKQPVESFLNSSVTNLLEEEEDSDAASKT